MERGIIKILGRDATSFAACIYNERKVSQGKAQPPIMRNFGDLERFNIHSPWVMSRYFQKIADQNPNVQHPQLHLMGSLRGNPTDAEKQQFIEQIEQVLDKLGYGRQPYAIWSHNDTENWHVHVATVRVDQETGQWINNWQEGRRARQYLDNLRGVTKKSSIENLLDFKFETKEQFVNLLRANGYRKSYYDEELDIVRVLRAGEEVHFFTMDEIQERIDRTGRNKDNQKQRIIELRGILRDRRQRSMNYEVDNPDVKTTKDGKHHTITERLRDVRGATFEGHEGLDIKGIRKAQFKQFLEELKEKMGIGIVFNQWKDGSTKGYTLIDYRNKTVFKGSDILALDELLNPNWRKGQEKDQILTADEAFGTTQQLVESASLASDIYEELSTLGLEIYEPDENEMTDIAVNFSDNERANREEAVHIFTNLIQNNPEPISEYDDDYNSIREEGQRAYNHAVTAEWLRKLDEEKVRNNQVNQDLVDEEPEIDRESLAWDEVGNYILDYFEENGIEYNFKPQFEFDRNGMDEKRARELAFEKFELAVYAHDNGWEDAADIAWESLAWVQVMEQLHKNPDLLNRSVEQKEDEKVQQGKEQPQTISSHPETVKRQAVPDAVEDREQAVNNAISRMNEYGNRTNKSFTDADILVISKGIVARCIENGWDSYNLQSLTNSCNSFREDLNLMPFTKTTVIADINREILGGYLAGLLDAMQQSGTGGPSNNELPKDKDRQWKHWMELFGMRPPRLSSGQKSQWKR